MAKEDSSLSSAERKSINHVSNKGLLLMASGVLLILSSTPGLFSNNTDKKLNSMVYLIVVLAGLYVLVKHMPFAKAFNLASTLKDNPTNKEMYKRERSKCVKYYDSIYRKADYVPYDGEYERDVDKLYYAKSYKKQNRMGDDMIQSFRVASRIMKPINQKMYYKRAKKLNDFINVCDRKYNEA